MKKSVLDKMFKERDTKVSFELRDGTIVMKSKSDNLLEAVEMYYLYHTGGLADTDATYGMVHHNLMRAFASVYSVESYALYHMFLCNYLDQVMFKPVTTTSCGSV